MPMPGYWSVITATVKGIQSDSTSSTTAILLSLPLLIRPVHGGPMRTLGDCDVRLCQTLVLVLSGAALISLDGDNEAVRVGGATPGPREVRVRFLKAAVVLDCPDVGGEIGAIHGDPGAALVAQP